MLKQHFVNLKIYCGESLLLGLIPNLSNTFWIGVRPKPTTKSIGIWWPIHQDKVFTVNISANH